MPSWLPAMVACCLASVVLGWLIALAIDEFWPL
jgi:hypothetical protein